MKRQLRRSIRHSVILFGIVPSLTFKLTKMQSMITTFADYEVYEYLLVLSPTGVVYQQLWSFKRDFKKTLNALFAIHTAPHLTLVVFLAYKKKEQKIINRLQTIVAGIVPFTVGMKDFGCFDQPKVIYVNIATKSPVQNVVDELKTARHLLKLNVGVPATYIDNPHITLCRGMEPQQYEKGWSKYSTLSYSGNFVANEMTLLKRVPGEHTCQSIAQFPFLSTPSSLKQGCLFV